MFHVMPAHYDKSPSLTTVRAVVDLLGGTTAMATALGVSPPSVSGWIHNGCFPPGRYLEISAAVETRGHRVDRSLFRATPDGRKGQQHAA
jgi:hypothetical protein